MRAANARDAWPSTDEHEARDLSYDESVMTGVPGGDTVPPSVRPSGAIEPPRGTGVAGGAGYGHQCVPKVLASPRRSMFRPGPRSGVGSPA